MGDLFTIDRGPRPHPLRSTFWAGLALLAAVLGMVARAHGLEGLTPLLAFVTLVLLAMFGFRLWQDVARHHYRRDLAEWEAGRNPADSFPLFWDDPAAISALDRPPAAAHHR